MTTTRRNILSAGAWTVPVIAFATAAPAAAASTPSTPPTKNRIAFTNLTATPGPKSNTLYINTKVQATDGPDIVENVVTKITVDGNLVLADWSKKIQGWGNTGIIKIDVPGLAKGKDIVVGFYSEATGVTPILGTVTVRASDISWWR